MSFWPSVLWQLLVDAPRPASLKSLDLLQHMTSYFTSATPFPTLPSLVGIGTTICKLRCGLLGSRRQSWRCLRAMRAPPLGFHKAL
eukprot:4654387-Pyramimonas_sp.AAC.1